ncbi:unnamed protein product [Medioppia subpectinata]|uniref:Uncharacterized protein n=1 Tax=Medioppia subpectinata TaxID=1979941 RepID=A0A7R9KH03_9ACAR|nr:unnamed protein product [Medioppia subpectinata]CAG2102446.1 unnamed protein product [Medioppia subpectinata]
MTGRFNYRLVFGYRRRYSHKVVVFGRKCCHHWIPTVCVDIEELVAKTITEFDKIDILVNNAGCGASVPFGDQKYIKNFDLVFNTNVQSIQVLTQLVFPYLELTKGNIINISSKNVLGELWEIVEHIHNERFSSVSGLRPSTIHVLSYHMAKSALDMFTKCLALQLGPKGVRVNSVNPAAIRTPFFETVSGDAHRLAVIEEHCRHTYPLGRIGEPEDVASAVAYLCSPAAAFITGAILPVDGGAYRAPGAY